MKKIVIVGSGASGVHFALSLLEKGYDVTMIDVGFKKPEKVNPKDHINALKQNLDDPVDYFIGKKFEAFISPDNDEEYYGFPPNKQYIFRKPDQFESSASGFSPLFSFARGGLAEAWTGGSYPLNEDELSAFPFGYGDLAPYYAKVSARIGISGQQDDLAGFYPYHENIMSPLPLDPLSSQLMAEYEKKKEALNARHQLYMGRSRVATLSQDKDGRQACGRSGRCLWGCPRDALYTPSITLEECQKYERFTYIPDYYVSHFKYDDNNRVTSVIAETVHSGEKRLFKLDRLVLAAGTLSSSKIFMESIYRSSRRLIKLKGLMDNRQVLMPFVNLARVGKKVDFNNCQYHQIALGLKSDNSEKYIHGQITTLKSALIHPIIKSIPCDLKTAIFIFRNFHSALGLINLNFHDSRREENYLSLAVDDERVPSKLLINYSPPENESMLLKRTIHKVKKAFRGLGCIFPPGMTHIRPMGASVHYCGTIPMTSKPKRYSATENCQSNDFRNLYFVDGTTLPFLPAKNLTFTLMANAVRVAEKAF